MEEKENIRRQVNTEEALKITGYKNERSLQRAVKSGFLTVEKIPNPDKNNVRENYYFEDELKALIEQKTKSETIKNPQHFPPGATTPDSQQNALSPIVGSQEGREFLQQLLTPIAEALEGIRQTQERLLPPAQVENPEPEEVEQPKEQFLTLEETKVEFPKLSPQYLTELWTSGKVTQHKGKHGRRLFSRKELENL